jgi:hypothetical protein
MDRFFVGVSVAFDCALAPFGHVLLLGLSNRPGARR